MTSLTLRGVKGSPLTNEEIDNNFSGLNTDKVEIGGDLSGNNFAPTVSAIQGTEIANTTPSNNQVLIYTTGTNASWGNTDLSLASNSSTVSISINTGNDVNIGGANTTTAGLITADSQTFSGDKTFVGNTSSNNFIEGGTALSEKYATSADVLAFAIALG